MRLTAVVRREGEVYVAQCLEIDVASQGRSIEESLDNLREALELHLAEPAQPVEAPSTLVVAMLEVVHR